MVSASTSGQRIATENFQPAPNQTLSVLLFPLHLGTVAEVNISFSHSAQIATVGHSSKVLY